VDEEASTPKPPRVSRRRFIGALGAAAAAGAFLRRGEDANAQSQIYYYQDSFGNVGPAGAGAIAMGVYPPPIPAAVVPPGTPGVSDTCSRGAANTSYYSCGYPKYNILLIMVDQMRNPGFWLPGGGNGLNAVDAVIPNISQLANGSFCFHNYWVAATVCGPSRACLLTGLYSQQTCQFKSLNPGNFSSPPLLPYNPSWSVGNSAGFPTIGNVLSQILNLTGSGNAYDCTWIGKWHLSCESGATDGSVGQNGPYDYGFKDSFSLPNAGMFPGSYPAGGNGYPSPNGYVNEGTGGDFLDSFAQSPAVRNVPNFMYGVSPPLPNNNAYPLGSFTQLNDAAIADAFTNFWLPYANTNLNGALYEGQLTTPWFCAVSFINPHDISDFPYAAGLAAGNSNFTPPSSNSSQYYEPAPQNTTPQNYYGNNCLGGFGSCNSDGDVAFIPGFLTNSGGLYTALPPGTGNSGPWNWEDLTSAALQYANNGKPGLQWWYLQNVLNDAGGGMVSPGNFYVANSWPNPTPWQTFLNYYMWLQSGVDYQVGRVLGTNPMGNNGLQQSPFSTSTVVIFTSDHGDYGGSHGLHAKGGALYEEALNVPLYISYPGQRANNLSAILPYVCSGVDLLPFLYSQALGNEQWRGNNNDMIYYLRNRESMFDAIHLYQNNTSDTLIQQRRISSIPLLVPITTSSCNAVSNSSCPAWQLYQPFVLHTADDVSTATLGNNSSIPQPSHAIAFRTVDLTNPNSSAAPFAGTGQNTYGGGKLGIYGYWNTCDNLSAPIRMINNNSATGTATSNQYEFYNYSPSLSLAANPQEVGNQYFNDSGGVTSEAAAYLTDFYNNNNVAPLPPGINVQNELYNLYAGASAGTPTQQVQAAIQVAWNNYLSYLQCSKLLTGSNGTPVGANSTSCPAEEACPNCSTPLVCGNYSA
jgi:arylsulfatase A-like enzyme